MELTWFFATKIFILVPKTQQLKFYWPRAREPVLVEVSVLEDGDTMPLIRPFQTESASDQTQPRSTVHMRSKCVRIRL